MFDDERRAKPLKIILDVLANPLTRPLSERPNVSVPCGRIQMSVLQAGRFIAHRLLFANGGSGLIGNSGRKTANVSDKHAKERTRNTATNFTALAFIILLWKARSKVSEDVPKKGQ